MESVESQVIIETSYRCAKCRKVNFVTTLQSVRAEFPHGFPQDLVEIWHVSEGSGPNLLQRNGLTSKR